MVGIIPASNTSTADDTFSVANSCKLENANTEYLHKTPSSSGNRRTFTLSAWIKRTGNLGANNYIFSSGDGDYNQYDRTLLKFNSDDTIYWGGGSAYELKTNRKFRDCSSWYHICMVVDTTDSTAGDRLKLYINGVRETSFSSETNPALNFEYAFMRDQEQVVGYNHTDSQNPMSCYLAEVVWLDGTAAAITDLGEFDSDSGIWKPKAVSSLSFGTNGCYLDFEDSSDMGKDSAGIEDWTLNNIAAADQATDTPTNNFAIFNIIVPNSANCAYTEGGTKVINSAGSYRSFLSTLAVTKGKWYAEFNGGNPNDMFGSEVAPVDTNGYLVDSSYMSSYTGGIGYYHNGNKYVSDSGSAYGNSITNANLIGCALDMDNGFVYFSKDNTWQNSGVPTSGASGTGGIALVSGYADKPYYMGTSNNNTAASYCNYGGYTAYSLSSAESDENGYGAFEYAPPTGFYALCSQNLAEYG